MALRPIEQPASTASTTTARRGLPANRAPYLFIAPFFILFIVFFLGPSIFAFLLSFFRWNAITAPRWIGLTNYVHLFNDPVALQAIGNTAIYMVASVFLVVPLALLLAVVLNSPRLHLQWLWRAMFFSPIVTSAVAVTLIFVLLYSRDYGLLNYTLGLVGISPIDWLGSTAWAKPAIIGLIMWRWVGYNMLYFLAGMQSISLDYYEAAQIDGANGAQQFWGITVPLLRPIIVYTTILTVIGSAQIFDETFILTQGGPANATVSIAQYLYTRGLGQLELGYAATIGMLMFAVIFILSLIQLRFFGRDDT